MSGVEKIHLDLTVVDLLLMFIGILEYMFHLIQVARRTLEKR